MENKKLDDHCSLNKLDVYDLLVGEDTLKDKTNRRKD